MSITKSPPVPVAQADDLRRVRPYVPPPRIIVGLLTGDGELVPREPDERGRDR